MTEEARTANDIQHGGTHYAAEIQHWDWVERNGMGYLEGCATKYATRNRKKHTSPVTDLKKAIHYVEKLLELHAVVRWNWLWSLPILRDLFPKLATRRFNRIRKVIITPEAFILANRLTYHEAEVIKGLTNWKNKHDLWYVRMFLQDMLDYAELEDKGPRLGGVDS